MVLVAVNAEPPAATRAATATAPKRVVDLRTGSSFQVGSPADPRWVPWLCVSGSHRICLWRLLLRRGSGRGKAEIPPQWPYVRVGHRIPGQAAPKQCAW